MFSPRNLMESLPTYGIGSPLTWSLGSKSFPDDPATANEWHLVTFAFIPDHCSQSLVISRRCWAEAGELARMQVSYMSIKVV